MAKDVFISYKAEEFNQADWVRTTLECRGIRCWMAPDSIPGGTSYATEIPKAIGECKVFVLILSRNAMASKWVPREVDQAINKAKTILPFMIEDCPLTDEFQFYLANVQCYMAFKDRNEAMNKLVAQIQSLLQKEMTKEQIRQKIRQNSGPGYSEAGSNVGGVNSTAGSAGTSVGSRPAGAGAGSAAGTKAGGTAAAGRVKTDTNPTKAAKAKKKDPVEGLVIAGFVCALLCCAAMENSAMVGLGVVLVLLTLLFTIRGRANIRKNAKRGKKLALAALVIGLLAAAPVFGLSFPGNVGLVIWIALIIVSVILYRKAAGKTSGKKKK